jgi:hypothetical protein
MGKTIKTGLVSTDENGEPWFMAADVCTVLSIGNPSDAIKRLDHDERARFKLGVSEMNIINESGLYSLILGSRKPEAKKFKKWVTSEVLPAIRIVPDEVGIDESKFAGIYRDKAKRDNPCYHLPRRKCDLIIATGLVAAVGISANGGN